MAADSVVAVSKYPISKSPERFVWETFRSKKVIMNNEAPTRPKLARGNYRCNACGEAFHARHGDWFISNNANTSQQFFLCKKCEVTMKDCYKRAIPIRG